MSQLSLEPGRWSLPNLPIPTPIENTEVISNTRVGVALISFALARGCAYSETALSGDTATIVSLGQGRELGAPGVIFRELRQATPIVTGITFADQWLVHLAQYPRGSYARFTAISPIRDLDVVVVPSHPTFTEVGWQRQSGHQALDASDDLLRWLDMTHEEVARLIGVARSTLF